MSKMVEFTKVNDYCWRIEKEGTMNVPIVIFASEEILEKIKGDKTIQQAINMASLPGVVDKVVVCPDAHQGYGACIGGVAAFDANNGIISPGMNGFDINCGVRLLTTNLKKEEVKLKIKPLLEKMFEYVPPGVGKKSKIKITQDQFTDVLNQGAKWALDNGYGIKEDIDNCEEFGTMPGADASSVSERARKRGIGQLGTLGSGNHFLEVQYVDKIHDKETAKIFGIENEGQVVVMIHCGSRGLGHQVCSDSLRKMEDAFPEIMASLPEKDLIYAPVQSDLAKEYQKAMCAAANFAWANRHIIAHQTRKAFRDIFGRDVKLHAVYDVAHNIVKKEKHIIEGKERELLIHRKGATRAFGPSQEGLPEIYQKTGQPIFIPGSMGTSSYVLVGTDESMKTSLGSTAHGAGRLMSRHAANKKWRGEEVKEKLEKEQIFIKAASWKGISEEAPLAYKDVDDVVDVSDKAHIGTIVAQLRPIGVVKG